MGADLELKLKATSSMLCFVLMVEDVSSQLPDLATIPATSCHESLLSPWNHKPKETLSSLSAVVRVFITAMEDNYTQPAATRL